MFGHVLQDCRASIGMLYLLPAGGKALELAVLSGGPWQMAAPWARVMLDDPLPLADAVRRQCAVWVGSQEEMARRYPRLGFVLPYDFVLAAFPVVHADAVWGGLVLLWPVRHRARPTARERDVIDAFCRDAGLVMQRAADGGSRCSRSQNHGPWPRSGNAPRTGPRPWPHTLSPSASLWAVARWTSTAG